MSNAASSPLPPDGCPAIRVVMMPRDTNGQGTIFGGVILSYIDQAGFVEASRQAPHRYVTVSMNKIDFKAPVFVGDILSLYGETLRIGRSSILVRVKAYAQRTGMPSEVIQVTEAEVTFVAIDEAHQPMPIHPKP